MFDITRVKQKKEDRGWKNGACSKKTGNRMKG